LASTMLPSTSSIRVFVQWSDQTVFAGEDIECQITFRNVASVSNPPRSSSHPGSLNGFTGRERQRKTSPLQTPALQAKNSSIPNSRAATSNRGHRSTLSLNVPVGSGRVTQSSGTRNNRPNEAVLEQRPHRRSVSIISLGISEPPGDETASLNTVGEGSRRPSKGHVRASSLQIVPRRSGINGAGPMSGRL
jgi:RAB6A-GEF complex partner protein 2